jgi:hypothetical protein
MFAAILAAVLFTAYGSDTALVSAVARTATIAFFAETQTYSDVVIKRPFLGALPIYLARRRPTR